MLSISCGAICKNAKMFSIYTFKRCFKRFCDTISCMEACLNSHNVYALKTNSLVIFVYFNIRFPFGLQPDLLNFKKGWMVKLDEQGQVSTFSYFFVNNLSYVLCLCLRTVLSLVFRYETQNSTSKGFCETNKHEVLYKTTSCY